MNLGISKRLALAMAAGALAGLGGGISVVGAHDVTFQQTVGVVTDTVSSPGDRYKVRGDVGTGSLAPKCEVDRTVKFFRELTGDDRLKGKDETNGEGEFKFVFPNGLKIGMYYLKVVKKILKKNDNHRHICEKTKTSSFTAGNNP